MGKTSYKSATELIENLAESIAKLNKGELSLNDLDTMTDQGRELYEQLVILRYKAFDKWGDTAVEPEKEVEPTPEPIPEKEETTEAPQETSFDFTGFEAPAEEEEEQPTFDFSLPETSEPETNPEPQPVKEEPVQVTEPTEIEDEPKSLNELNEDDGDSLNEVLKKDGISSLRKQLQNSPIADIKAEISIAKKFEYITSMFGGSADAYNTAIDNLNNCENGEIAREKLNEYSALYNWDLEDKSIIKFVELVERRYS